jgi:hypothetical protein
VPIAAMLDRPVSGHTLMIQGEPRLRQKEGPVLGRAPRNDGLIRINSRVGSLGFLWARRRYRLELIDSGAGSLGSLWGLAGANGSS